MAPRRPWSRLMAEGVESGKMIAVEAEGDVMRHGRPGTFLQCRRIQDKQERSLLPEVEYNGKQDAVVFGRVTRTRDKHRLAGVAAVLMPGPSLGSLLRAELNLGDVIHEVCRDGLACSPHISIRPPGVAAIVDARQLYGGRTEGPPGWLRRLLLGLGGGR